VKKLPKKHLAEPESHDRWLVSYADFITLLFAFFVVMFATNNNAEKQKEFEKSVRVNLHLANGSAGKNSKPDAGVIIAEYLQGEGVTAEGKDPDSENYPSSTSGAEGADYAARYLAKHFDKEVLKENGLEVRHDAIGVRVTLAASSVFPAGEHKMKRSALEILNKLGDLLQRTDKKVIIEGHTDDRPVNSATGVTNWELASLRATSVVRYLIKSKGLDPKRMAAISYADQKPLAPNDSEENRSKNRRIEILIVNKDEN
jgi:chemotaxis protein MotB